MPVIDFQRLFENRTDAIRQYHKQVGLDRAELDVSGGIDSAVMLHLLAHALGPDKVTAVYSSINSSDESKQRARAAAESARVNLVELDLTTVFDQIVHDAMKAVVVAQSTAHLSRFVLVERMKNDPTILGSFRSCFRAPIGRFLNRLTGGGIRHGTGNEDEDRWLRFYQKGGDGEVDTNPLAMLSKGEVYQLAVHLGVPSEIITCRPTPDLWGAGEAHNDEAELLTLSGVAWTYSRVDPATGQYIYVGTIERMSRMLDQVCKNGDQEMALHMDDDDEAIGLVDIIAKRFGLELAHVESMIKWEASTRHKMNPNCPSLGSREELLQLGILSQDILSIP